MLRVYELMNLRRNEIKADIDNENFIISKAVINNKCQRCGYKLKLEYCNNCEEFGRIYENDKLYQLKSKPAKYKFYGIKGKLTLTEKQKECSDFLLRNNNKALVWAVCGAGKTEITFDVITKNLKRGENICFAITRKDILYEIRDRLKDYYVDVDIAVLNSDEEKFVDAQIYVMTTNQLLRFKNAFSLIIIDEVDAFPFNQNDKFIFAINNAAKKDSKIIYLTSTPSEKILNENLDTFIINRRYHQYKLPVPILKKYKLKSSILPLNIVQLLMYSSRQQLIFINNKKHCKEMYDHLKKLISKSGNYVHSQRENRLKIIEDFKNEKHHYLITTTILERGVTFKDIDVHVLDSDNELYEVSSLIQIAGRVNRKADYQEGKVYFYYSKMNSKIEDCIKQIEKMNNMK